MIQPASHFLNVQQPLKVSPRRRKKSTEFVAVFVAVCLAGCGRSDLATVTGTVTLDDQPLENAIVEFSPTTEGQGAPSYGRTDASGNFTLQYTRDQAGAELGEHRVSITTESSGDQDAVPPVPASPERVPARYNWASELRETVVAGDNTFTFQLTSDGDVMNMTEGEE